MNAPAPRVGQVRKWTVHALRVGLFVVVLALLRARHNDFLAAQPRNEFGLVTLERVQPFLPEAHELRAPRGVSDSQTVFNEEGSPIGSVLVTAPASDGIIGFSGPSNLLVVLNSEERIIGLAILTSGDTPEHVRQVELEGRFLGSYQGLTLAEAANRAQVQAVSGATLTSLALAAGLERRLAGRPRSLKFPAPVSAEQLQPLFPNASAVTADAGEPSVLRVTNAAGSSLGWALRTSPAADNIVGYQGPTEALVGFNESGRVIGVLVGQSYDNEPYVNYVRNDAYFRAILNGRTLEEVAAGDARAPQVEGVSGATMTSQAVAQGIMLAAKQQHSGVSRPKQTSAAWAQVAPADVATIGIILAGIVIGFTRWRQYATVRLLFQLTVLLYLGFVNGTLLSQAQLVGWARSGVPRGAAGLVALTAAALLLPMATKRNVYCTHLCPHGALQQLALRSRWRVRVSPLVRRLLALVPAGLLVWCLLVGLLHWPYSLVHVEAFDAYAFRVAGWATICLALVGGVASLFVPLAYCKYGCPTGAVLEYVRRHGRSDRFTRRDLFAVGCLVLALVLWWV